MAESLGNYRWAVQLGLQLCREYRLGRGKSVKKAMGVQHASEDVLKWLKDGRLGSSLKGMAEWQVDWDSMERFGHEYRLQI